MKKTFLLIASLMLFASMSHGASITWIISGKNTALKDYASNVAAGTTVYLILADSTSLASITDIEGKDAFEDALAAITVGSVTADSDGKKPEQTTVDMSSSLLTAGNSYTLASLYLGYDSDGNGYYRYASNTGTAFDPSVEGSAGTISTSWANMGTATWTKGYTAVPEPSTAALALAGLALLLKRRKA